MSNTERKTENKHESNGDSKNGPDEKSRQVTDYASIADIFRGSIFSIEGIVGKYDRRISNIRAFRMLDSVDNNSQLALIIYQNPQQVGSSMWRMPFYCVLYNFINNQVKVLFSVERPQIINEFLLLPDKVISGDDQGNIEIYDLSGKKLATCSGGVDRYGVNSLAINLKEPNQLLGLFTRSPNEFFKCIWDINTGELLHRSAIERASFGATGIKALSTGGHVVQIDSIADHCFSSIYHSNEAVHLQDGIEAHFLIEMQEGLLFYGKRSREKNEPIALILGKTGMNDHRVYYFPKHLMSYEFPVNDRGELFKPFASILPDGNVLIVAKTMLPSGKASTFHYVFNTELTLIAYKEYPFEAGSCFLPKLFGDNSCVFIQENGQVYGNIDRVKAYGEEITLMVSELMAINKGSIDSIILDYVDVKEIIKDLYISGNEPLSKESIIQLTEWFIGKFSDLNEFPSQRNKAQKMGRAIGFVTNLVPGFNEAKYYPFLTSITNELKEWVKVIKIQEIDLDGIENKLAKYINQIWGKLVADKLHADLYLENMEKLLGKIIFGVPFSCPIGASELRWLASTLGTPKAEVVCRSEPHPSADQKGDSKPGQVKIIGSSASVLAVLPSVSETLQKVMPQVKEEVKLESKDDDALLIKAEHLQQFIQKFKQFSLEDKFEDAKNSITSELWEQALNPLEDLLAKKIKLGDQGDVLKQSEKSFLLILNNFKNNLLQKRKDACIKEFESFLGMPPLALSLSRDITSDQLNNIILRVEVSSATKTIR